MKRAIALATESTRRDGTRQGFAAPRPVGAPLTELAPPPKKDRLRGRCPSGDSPGSLAPNPDPSHSNWTIPRGQVIGIGNSGYRGQEDQQARRRRVVQIRPGDLDLLQLAHHTLVLSPTCSRAWVGQSGYKEAGLRGGCMLTETGSDALLRLHRTDGLAQMFRAHAVRAHYRVYSQSPSASRRSISASSASPCPGPMEVFPAQRSAVRRHSTRHTSSGPPDHPYGWPARAARDTAAGVTDPQGPPGPP